MYTILSVTDVIILNFLPCFWRSDYGLPQGKPVFKKENGTPAYGGSMSYASSVMDNNLNRQLPSQLPSYRYYHFHIYIYMYVYIYILCKNIHKYLIKFLWASNRNRITRGKNRLLIMREL